MSIDFVDHKRAEEYALKAVKFLYEYHSLILDPAWKNLSFGFCGDQAKTIEERLKKVCKKLIVAEDEIYPQMRNPNHFENESNAITRTGEYELRADNIIFKWKLFIFDLKRNNIVSQLFSCRDDIKAINDEIRTKRQTLNIKIK